MMAVVLGMVSAGCSDTGVADNNERSEKEYEESGRQNDKEVNDNVESQGTERNQNAETGAHDEQGASTVTYNTDNNRFYGEWLEPGEVGAMYQGASEYIVAIFNAGGALDHFKEYSNTNELLWSCDWQIIDERGQEHEYCVGFADSYVSDGKRYYTDEIYRKYNLDYCLEWPFEYYENDSLFPERNQQFVTVNANEFVLWWRSMKYVEEYKFYYEFEDRHYEYVKSSGAVPSFSAGASQDDTQVYQTDTEVLQANYILLESGSIVNPNQAIYLDQFETAVFVVGNVNPDEEVWYAGLGGIGYYYAEQDFDPTWAYEGTVHLGDTIPLSKYMGFFMGGDNDTFTMELRGENSMTDYEYNFPVIR